MTIKVKNIDQLVFILLVPILLTDMLNGFMFENNISTFFSIGQFYKIIIICLCSLRIISYPQYFRVIFWAFCVLMVPSIIKIIQGLISIDRIVYDMIKTIKFLILPISFFYFRIVFTTTNNKVLPYFVFWIKTSFFILAFNLISKLVGFGYPMYRVENIGSRGYFIAGNEISALLLVLSGFLGYYSLIIKRSLRGFLIYAIVSFCLGLLISSKTGIAGVILVFLMIFLTSDFFSIKEKKQRKVLFLFTSIFTILVSIAIYFIQKSSIIERYSYYWKKLDVYTFILSSRNTYFKEMLVIYNENYDLIDCLFGVGASRYETLAGRYVEIDFLDVFFIYGISGIVLLSLYVGYMLVNLAKIRNEVSHPFSKLSMIMIFLLLILSCLSGHILNSGIAGIFIGFVFSLMYVEVK
ncbi:O-antigen ligase family protein [Myroides phaeus]|uniref:O-antigen ligase family protein n=1 Tax=Myroides phaeus TaxID=702745 RepID=UPI0013036C96|nr:O-antigen ligase family protein [Myroides phaeus]